jgi:hypothetical protein
LPIDFFGVGFARANGPSSWDMKEPTDPRFPLKPSPNIFLKHKDSLTATILDLFLTYFILTQVSIDQSLIF